MTKTERQNISIKKVIDNNFNGILNLCVRFGKTRIGILIQNEYIKKHHKPFTVIITPSQTILNGWIKESELIDIPVYNVTTANTIINYGKTTKINLLIVDEAHRFTSTEWYKIINKQLFDYDNIIMLTATLPTGKDLEKLTKFAPIIDKIDETEAINNGWISNFIQYNIPLNLSDPLKERYIQLTDKISAVLSEYRNMYKSLTYDGNPIFDSDLDMLYSIQRGKYLGKDIGKLSGESIIESLSKLFKVDKLYIYESATNFIKAIETRNNLIASNEVKFDALIYIIKTLNVPTIVFSSSIYFSDRIEDELNNIGISCKSIHSKTPSQPLIDYNENSYYVYKSGNKAGDKKIFSKNKVLEHTIAAMAIGKIKVISTVNKLNEGVTIPEIECIIITSGSINPIQQVQREGRGKNLGITDKVTKIYNLYIEDIASVDKVYESRDKIKLNQRQVFSSNIKTINLVDI